MSCRLGEGRLRIARNISHNLEPISAAVAHSHVTNVIAVILFDRVGGKVAFAAINLRGGIRAHAVVQRSLGVRGVEDAAPWSLLLLCLRGVGRCLLRGLRGGIVGREGGGGGDGRGGTLLRGLRGGGVGLGELGSGGGGRRSCGLTGPAQFWLHDRRQVAERWQGVGLLRLLCGLAVVGRLLLLRRWRRVLRVRIRSVGLRGVIGDGRRRRAAILLLLLLLGVVETGIRTAAGEVLD